MHAVDTNLLIRFLLRDDQEQAFAARTVLLTNDIWISKTVILETEWVLRSVYKFTPAAVEEALVSLLGLDRVEVEHATAVATALDLFREGMDFADALHLASRPENATFITFDESLVRQAKRAGLDKVQAPERSRRPRR